MQNRSLGGQAQRGQTTDANGGTLEEEWSFGALSLADDVAALWLLLLLAIIQGTCMSCNHLRNTFDYIHNRTGLRASSFVVGPGH